MFAAAFVAVFLVAACSSSRLVPESEACRTMREQIREKQDLDARVKALSKQVAKEFKAGDSAAAVSDTALLRGLVENQRYLKESLERSSRDCTPSLKDVYSPVLDPAHRQRLEEPR